MCMLTKRVHMLFDDEQYARVAAAAKARKVSFAEIVREAVDVVLPPRWPERAGAAAAILAAEPMEVPKAVSDLKAELDTLRGRRG